MEQSAGVHVKRLGVDDVAVATRMFALMTEIFDTPGEALSETYVSELLRRPEFWAVVALVADEVVGGLTAHELPMTRNESGELLIYDLAVSPDRQREGIGRRLVNMLSMLAAERGIDVTFVLADNEDEHAVAFYRALGGEPSDVTMFDLPPG